MLLYDLLDQEEQRETRILLENCITMAEIAGDFEGEQYFNDMLDIIELITEDDLEVANTYYTLGIM